MGDCKVRLKEINLIIYMQFSAVQFSAVELYPFPYVTIISLDLSLVVSPGLVVVAS